MQDIWITCRAQLSRIMLLRYTDDMDTSDLAARCSNIGAYS